MQKRENKKSLLVWEKNFNCTNLVRHAKSAYDKRVEVASTTQPITMVVAHARNKAETALIAASRNLYWLAKELLATYKYSSLNSLQECAAMHDGKNAQYTSYHIAEKIQEAITHGTEEDIDHLLSDSPFGLVLDESTDIASSKNLIVSVRLITHGTYQTHFLKLQEVKCQANERIICNY